MTTGGVARYVFAVRFRLDPDEGVTTEPTRFETRLSHRADPPGEDGWLFFRDFLWHGALNDPEYARERFGNALGVTVTDAEFRGLHTDETYLDSLREAVAANLDLFNAETVDGALSKYLGSSIQLE